MKKLENEYRQLMQNETPDLWSRIEAGIDAKIAADNVTNSNTDSEMAEVSRAESNEIGNVVEFAEKKSFKKGKTGVNLWKKYSLPLVACIAVIICVPLLLTGFIRMASGGKAETTEMAADTAAADCAAPEETTSVAMDCADEPAAAIVTEESCGEIDDSFAETESEPIEEPEAMLDGAVTESTTEEAAKNTAEDSKQSAEQPADLVQILTVTQISQGIEDYGESREKGAVYYLTTEEAGECTLFVPDDAEFEFDMEIQFKIQVEPGNEEYDFVFMNIIE